MSTKPKTPKAPARMASAPKPDPIFALIAEHQAAIDHLDTVWKLTGGDDAPGYAAAEDIEGKTFKRLINTKSKCLQCVRTKRGHERDIRRVTTARDGDAANARRIVARVESEPASIEKDFEPGVVVHRAGSGGTPISPKNPFA